MWHIIDMDVYVIIYRFCFHFFYFLQISLIDRVHKIYNDTIWQDRAVWKKHFEKNCFIKIDLLAFLK